MMMDTYKRQHGQSLGSEKVRESSGEGGETIGDIQAPPKTYNKNAYVPKIQIHRYFLTLQKTSKSISSSKALWGMCSLGKRVRSLVRRNWLSNRMERNQVSGPNPRLDLSPCGFIVTIVGDVVTRVSFASRRGVRREWQRNGITRTSTTFPIVYLSLVCSVTPQVFN
jgi:hypothetical protein